MRRDLNRVIEFSEQYKDEFLKILLDNTGAEMERQSNYLEDQIEKLTKRNTELDRLFNSVYEDKVNGTVSEERFKRMTQGFETEQNDNIIEIDRCKKLLNARTVEIDTAKAFLDIIEKTTCIEKLTAPVLREFVDKIIIHHRHRLDGEEVQKIEIFYNVIGKFIIPVHLYALDEVAMDTRQGVHVVALTA